jgi:hypothetical protein
MKHGFTPNVTKLEGREQPGSLFSTGLDSAILAGAFLGDGLIKASRPAIVATQNQARQTDATDVTLQRPTQVLSNPAKSNASKPATINSLDQSVTGLAVPNNSTAMTLSEYVGARPELYHNRPDNGGTKDLTLFYNGDLDGRNGLANEYSSIIPDAFTQDDARIRTGYEIDCLASRNLQTADFAAAVTKANFKIMGPGQISEGSPLAMYASGTALAATNAATGFSAFGLLEYETKICGLGRFSIPSGHYYLTTQPIGAGSGRSFNSTTSGAGPTKGQPINNDNTWFTGAYWGYYYTDTNNIFGAGSWDMTQKIEGTLP